MDAGVSNGERGLKGRSSISSCWGREMSASSSSSMAECSEVAAREGDRPVVACSDTSYFCGGTESMRRWNDGPGTGVPSSLGEAASEMSPLFSSSIEACGVWSFGSSSIALPKGDDLGGSSSDREASRPVRLCIPFCFPSCVVLGSYPSSSMWLSSTSFEARSSGCGTTSTCSAWDSVCGAISEASGDIVTVGFG